MAFHGKVIVNNNPTCGGYQDISVSFHKADQSDDFTGWV
jgi:hypothetical protein